MTTTTAVQRLFLSSAHFAVVGASADRSKFGNKVLRWYMTHGLDVVPINPKLAQVEGLNTIGGLDDLPSPTSTSVSIITPPSVTLAALKKAQDLGIPAVWIQPGASDEAVERYISEKCLEDKVIHGGPCILVHGDRLLSSRL